MPEDSQPTPPTAPTAAPEPAKTAPASRSLLHRATRWVAWIVIAVLLIWGALWLAVPPLARWQGQKIASQELGRPVTIGKIQFKPWSLELTVHDLAIGGLPGQPDQLTVKRIYVNASIQSLLKLGPVLDAVQVDDPVLRLTRQDGNHYDVDDIVARLTSQPKPAKPSKPLNFALYNIVLQGGRIDLDDRVVGRVQKLDDLRLAVPFVSDLPAAREVKVQPQLAFTLNGSRFESHADALPFDPSRRTEAGFKFSQFDLEPWLGYLPADLPLKLQAGVIDADLRLTFEQTPKPALHLSGTADLTKLKAADGKGSEALAFDALKVQLADVQPLSQQFHLAAVELDRPSVAVQRYASGAINLMPQDVAGKKASDERAKSPETAAISDKPAPEADAADAPKLALLIDELAVHGGTVDWRDEAVAGKSGPPAAIRVGQLELAAEGIAYPFDKPFKLNGSAALESGASAAPAPAHAATKDEKAPASAEKAAEEKPEKATAPAHATLKFDGQVSPARGDVTIHTAGVPLTLAAPYLAAYLEPHLSGTAGADARVQWAPAKGKDQSPAWTVTAQHVQLDSLLLTGAEAAPRPRRSRSARPGELASIGQLQLADVKVDPQAESVSVGRIGIKEPRIVVERDRQQHWMFERWLREPASAERAAAKHKEREAPRERGKAAPHWTVHVNDVALEGGTVGWIDEATPQAVHAEITDLQVSANKLDLDGKRPMGLDVSARIGTGRRSDGEPGKLSWRGEVAWDPVSASGTVDAVRLPLQAFEPYVHDALNVQIARAEGSFKGHVAYAATERGPRVQVKGDARVDDLRTFTRPGTAVSAESAHTKGDAEKASVKAPAGSATATPAARRRAGNRPQELFSARQLSLGGLDVQLAPGRAPRIGIGHTVLSGFFARIVISPSGRINLQDIANSSAVEARKDNTPAGPEAKAHVAAPSPLAPVIRFGPTRLVGGHIDFTDHFIRPNYSADLTALNGSLGAFSSATRAGATPQMAELKLTGTAEGSATLDVEGQINPLADPLALDIKAKVTDLDLPPLSPYAIKYSGHGIERGKLSLDVAYKIQPDGQLTATNKLVLNQLQFGAPVAGAPTSLPVQLATALLANSDGVINLDLPISGSINDPEFSIGPIIFKAVMNLIGKAITAPFTLIAHALGSIGASGQDLSQVVFAPGSAQLSAKARTQLDGVAKALSDRPNLKLTVAGSARLADEEEGAKRQRLYAMAAAEERHEAPASAASGSTATPPANAADIASSDEYPALLKRLYRRDDIPGKPRNFIGMQRDVPVAEMEKLMMAHMHVGQGAMRQLAEQRAVAVKDYLASKGIATARLFLGAVQTGSGTQDKTATDAAGDAAATGESKPAAAWVPHAQLSLGMN